MPTLSKSRFVSGNQCEKKLFFDLFRRDLKPEITEEQQALFNSGHRFGELAQQVFPDGTLKEERTPKETFANILAEFPIKPVGKYLPKKDIYNKFVFSKKYQITHVNGLTFDFLYEMAKDLHDNNALMMLAGGEKGNEPLVFQDGGKTYRAFLEGRIKEKSYVLLLHLSNLELKGI